MTELWSLGAVAMAAAVKRRDASSRELLDACRARVGAVNGAMNAVVELLDEAIDAAELADRATQAGHPTGPLHGVPFTVKTCIDVAGSPTTSGAAALEGAMASVDAPIVERLRAAGAIPFARTNMPDFGLRNHTISSLYGRTRNPWHSEVTAGGSSGGEAAALATGMTPLGVGTDLGGSLRNPAHCCGIATLKPSTGVVPRAAALPPADWPLTHQLMLVEGPMARTVDDLGVALSIIAGPHPRDPLALPVLLPGPPSDRPLRIAVCPDPPGAISTTAPSIAALRRCADLLDDAGHVVVDELPGGYDQVAGVWSAICMADLRSQQVQLDALLEGGVRVFLELIDAQLPVTDSADLAALHVTRHAIEKQWHTFFSRWDVLLLPACPSPAVPNDVDVATAQGATAGLHILEPLLPANLLGLPAAVVPCGLVEGLPVGAQIVGRRFADRTVLEAAAQVEALLGVLTPMDPIGADAVERAVCEVPS